MPTKHLYLWKSPANAADEVSVGEILYNRLGEPNRYEHLVLHVDSMLELFDVDVYRQVAALTPEDDPIPLTLSIQAGESGASSRRSFVQAPSESQRRSPVAAQRDRRA